MEGEGEKNKGLALIVHMFTRQATVGLPFLSAGSGCTLVFFGMGIWGELATSDVSMVRGVAGREDTSGVSVMEFFLESEGGAFTLDTKGGRKERGREGDRPFKG